MHKFGSTGLVTGFIKQLLASFELPTVRVYTEEHAQYFEQHHHESPFILESFDGLAVNVPKVAEGTYDTLSSVSNLQVSQSLRVPYLKDGRVQFYLGGYYTSDNTFVPGKWQDDELDVNKTQGGSWDIYNRGAAYLNQTKKLQIRNNIYDSYTHEYLGNYLRFLRDYDGLDLMPLYNCFSNRLCSETLGLNVKLFETNNAFGSFNAADGKYKIYLVPVKLFKKYTIAIDSASPVEMCCGLYNSKLDTSLPAYQSLLTKTYVRKSSTCFGQPFVYSSLLDLAPKELPEFPTSTDIRQHSAARNFLAYIANREANLTLILKVHKEVSSSIVILEGDYVGWNDFSAQLETPVALTEKESVVAEKKINLKHNHTVMPNELIFNEISPHLISPLHLLKLNTGTQIPFSNRLLEYLLNMCITGGVDEAWENVLMAQTLMCLRYRGRNRVIKYYPIVAIQKDESGNTQKSFVAAIYAQREYCQQPGDRYIRYEAAENSTEMVQKVYKYTYFDKDIYEGNLNSAVNSWLENAKNSDDLLFSGKQLAIADLITSSPSPLNYDLLNGVWTPALRKLFYKYMTVNTEHNISAHQDILGYVDKDTEKYFTATTTDKKGKQVRKTMLNFDAWEDLTDAYSW